MRSEIVKKILEETPLEIRLKVSNQMFLIHSLTELGFRENKTWDENNEEDNKLLLKIFDLAREHTKHQIRNIEQWEADGRPKS